MTLAASRSTLDEERFKDYLSLDAGNFSLTGAPSGTGIQLVTGNSPTEATVLLQFNNRDFDIDYNNFRLVIDSAELIQTENETLISNPLSIIAWVENPPQASIVEDSTMTEYRLDYRNLTLSLSEEWFRNPGGTNTY